MIVGIVCLLSVLGSVLIILSFVCFMQLRSRARQILVHISIMDLGVGLVNLTGSLVYFDQYFDQMSPSNCTLSPNSVFSSSLQIDPTTEPLIWCPQSLLVRDLCIIQAFLAVYFTLGSVFWSNCLTFYLYFRIVYVNSKLVTYVFRFSWFVSYCFPLLITTWLLLTGRLGFSPYESEGWCSIIMDNPSTEERNLFVSTFGYNIWIGITFIVIPLLSLAIYLHVKKVSSIYEHIHTYTVRYGKIIDRIFILAFGQFLSKDSQSTGKIPHVLFNRGFVFKTLLGLELITKLISAQRLYLS